MKATYEDLTVKDLQNFGLTTGCVLAGLFGAVFPWLLGRSMPIWPWALGGLLIAWGLLAPATLKPIRRSWLGFGNIMSKITTPIILGLVFFIAVVPTGLIRRLLGRDSMARSLDDSTASYRVESNRISKQNLKRPF